MALDEKEGKYRCLICSNGKEISQKCKTDYNALKRHALTHGQEFEGFYQKSETDFASSAGQKKLSDYRFTTIDDKARDIYEWTDLIISEHLPFSFCEKPKTREKAKMNSISTKTFVKYMQEIEKEMVNALKDEFKDKILGLIFEGTGNHYVAIFVCYEGSDVI